MCPQRCWVLELGFVAGREAKDRGACHRVPMGVLGVRFVTSPVAVRLHDMSRWRPQESTAVVAMRPRRLRTAMRGRRNDTPASGGPLGKTSRLRARNSEALLVVVAAAVCNIAWLRRLHYGRRVGAPQHRSISSAAHRGLLGGSRKAKARMFTPGLCDAQSAGCMEAGQGSRLGAPSTVVAACEFASVAARPRSDGLVGGRLWRAGRRPWLWRGVYGRRVLRCGLTRSALAQSVVSQAAFPLHHTHTMPSALQHATHTRQSTSGTRQMTHTHSNVPDARHLYSWR